jgi:GNAT superfamily N-acetyltransferase
MEYVVAFKNIVEDRNQELIVLTDEKDKIIGTLQLSYLQYLTYQGGIRAQIEAVRISKEFRGKGYGSLLINWAIDRSKARGAHMLQLTTDKKRPEAKEFYEKLGFVSSHEGMKMYL